jgi:DNA-binding transcriptional MerR regulator
VATAPKDPGALKTMAQHFLRYWETKFPQLKPMQRAGNRRYYRPADVELARRIHRLLSEEGYTVRGVQKLLREKGVEPSEAPPPAPPAPAPEFVEPSGPNVDVFRLIALRNRLAEALDR